MFAMPTEIKPDPFASKKARCTNPNAITSVDDLIVGRKWYTHQDGDYGGSPRTVYEITKVELEDTDNVGVIAYRKIFDTGMYGTEEFHDTIFLLMFNNGISIL